MVKILYNIPQINKYNDKRKIKKLIFKTKNITKNFLMRQIWNIQNWNKKLKKLYIKNILYQNIL